MHSPIDIVQLKKLLRYEPHTGTFYWKISKGSVRAGKVAGHLNENGYVYICINGISYFAHRLAWLITYEKNPPNEIDHINGNPSDNRIKNLRCATRSENARNQARRTTSTTGYKGVSRHRKKYQATIKHYGKQIHLGCFNSPEEAHLAYCKVAEKLYGEFARSF